MKKKWIVLPLASLLAIGLVFVGCDSAGGGGADVDDGSVWYNVLAASGSTYVLEVKDNFQYGEGYQGQVDKSDLFKGKKVLEGGTYWLKATFTVSRDLEDAVWAGIVDTITNYWNPLTWDGADEDDEGTLIAPTDDDGVYAVDSDKNYIIKKGAEISGLFKFVALKTAESNATNYNVLNFQTKGEGTEGTAGSGVKEPFEITFTEFIFAKDVTFSNSKIPGFTPPPAVLEITLADGDVTASDGATITYIDNGYELTRTAAWEAAYAWFEADLDGKTLADFSEIIVKYQGVSGDIGWKNVALWASVTEFDGSNPGGTGLAALQVQLGSGPQVSGTDAYNNLSIEIDAEAATEIAGTATKVYLAIFINANVTGDSETTVYQISNVRLQPKS